MSIQTMHSAGENFEARVAGEIRAEMARQRLSNRQLALRMGKTPYWVGDRLALKTHLEVGDLQVFADALGVSVEQFVVRHQGLEPRTRWLSETPSQPQLPFLFAVPDPAPAADDAAA